MNKKSLLFMLILFVILSSFIVSARTPFDSIGSAISKIFTTEFTIPHPGYDSVETVTIAPFLAGLILLTALFYALIQWDKSHLTFLAENHRITVTVAITLSLLSIYSVPFIEWLSWLLGLAWWLIFVIASGALVFFAYVALHGTTGAAVHSMAKSGKYMKEGLEKLRDVKVVEDQSEIESTLSDSRKIIENLNPKKCDNFGQYLDFISKLMSAIPQFNMRALGIPSLGSEASLIQENEDGRVMLREMADKIRELKNHFLHHHDKITEIMAITEGIKKVTERKEEYAAGIDPELEKYLDNLDKQGRDLHHRYVVEMEKYIKTTAVALDKLRSMSEKAKNDPNQNYLKKLRKFCTEWIQYFEKGEQEIQDFAEKTDDSEIIKNFDNIIQKKVKHIRDIFKKSFNNNSNKRQIPAGNADYFVFETDLSKHQRFPDPANKYYMTFSTGNNISSAGLTIHLKLTEPSLDRIQEEFEKRKIKDDPTTTPQNWQDLFNWIQTNFKHEGLSIE